MQFCATSNKSLELLRENILKSSIADNTHHISIKNISLRVSVMTLLNNYIKRKKLNLEQIVEKFQTDPTTVSYLLQCRIAYLPTEDLLSMLGHYKKLCN